MAEAISATVAATRNTQTGSPAFDLLVTAFEADGRAMENCGDHHWEVECALERAAGIMAEAAKSLPAAAVKEKIKALRAVDYYGVRKVLSRVIADDRL